MTVYAFACDHFQWWYRHEPGNKVRLLTMAETEMALAAFEAGLLRIVKVDWLGGGAVKRVAA